MEAGFQAIEQLIRQIERLGTLSNTAVFALVTVFLGYILYSKQKTDDKISESRIRNAEDRVKIDTTQTEIMRKMADDQQDMKGDISTIKTILDERLPNK